MKLWSLTFLEISFSSVVFGDPACTLRGPKGGCTSVDEWKSDLLCRLLGVSNDSTGGYFDEFSSADIRSARRGRKNLGNGE